mmetsp:Transcript_50348/g.120092  ORF Transcript_50348/g.120092 Transcript_50348/m.120092 type:complete len:229 (+) Transcript_50348:2586-3272(+)
MGIAGDAFALRFSAEVHELVDGKSTFCEGTRIRTGRSMALHPHAVTPAVSVLLAAEEVVHTHLNDIANRREGADVSSNTASAPVAITDHDGRIPSDDVGNALLHGPISWILGLCRAGDSVHHWGHHRLRNVHAQSGCFLHQVMQKEARSSGALLFYNRIKRFEPLLGFSLIEARSCRFDLLMVGRIVACVLMHERQGGRECRHLPLQALGKLSVGDDSRLVCIKMRKQ